MFLRFFYSNPWLTGSISGPARDLGELSTLKGMTQTWLTLPAADCTELEPWVNIGASQRVVTTDLEWDPVLCAVLLRAVPVVYSLNSTILYISVMECGIFQKNSILMPHIVRIWILDFHFIHTNFFFHRCFSHISAWKLSPLVLKIKVYQLQNTFSFVYLTCFL